MQLVRFAKCLATVALFNGLLVLGLYGELSAKDKLADAQKYTRDLKTSKDPKVRVRALQELGKLAQILKEYAAEALPDIYKALDDKDPSVRAAAALCLGLCDEPADKAIPLLVKLLKEDKENTVKIGATKGLAAMGPGAKPALPALRAAVKNDKKSPLGRAANVAIKAINVKN